MRNIPIALILLLSLEACNNNNNNSSGSPINCYQYANGKDTITLKLIHVGESITGTLVYKLHEKDKNMGTIQGSMRGDLLVADYTFMSEGAQSVRQVAFKNQGAKMVEGYGEMKELNGKMIFSDTDSLQFNEKFALSEIKCE